MLIALVLATAAVAYGIVRGGSLEGLAATPLRWVALLFAGLGLQMVAGLWSPTWLTRPLALLVILVSNLAILVFVAVNRLLPGMLLADLGVALNLLVIVLNGAMPVSAAAARTAGVETAPAAVGLKHERMSDDTHLPWLGDVIPTPGVGEVLSLGDILLAAGIARLVYVRTIDPEFRPPSVKPRRVAGSRPATRPAPPP